MYPVGVIPFTYVSSFIFTSEIVAQTVTIFVHFVFAGICSILTYYMRIIDPMTMDIGDQMNKGFKLIPSFCLTNSIMFSSSRSALFAVRPELLAPDLDLSLMGGDLLALGLHFVFWLLVLILIELGAFNFLSSSLLLLKKNRLPPRIDLLQDEDVLAEEHRVLTLDNSHFQVKVQGLRKVYPSLFRKPALAVERTSFGVKKGECFALLGVNGAGKTTTFKTLTREIEASGGQVYIGGKEVGKARSRVGYCPQHDAIFELMTVEEHMEYYSRLKGIPSKLRKLLINRQISDMNLSDHRHKPAGTLSGGNKRKLSVALAILGTPPIVLLDEPSAGMDPEARRSLWSSLSRLSLSSALILTTHSMEEAEALSTKMGIMVKGGVFRCFGSSQHIKNKFGTGYEIEVKIQKLSAEDLAIMGENYGHGGEERVKYEELGELMRNKMCEEWLID